MKRSKPEGLQVGEGDYLAHFWCSTSKASQWLVVANRRSRDEIMREIYSFFDLYCSQAKMAVSAYYCLGVEWLYETHAFGDSQR